MMIQTAPRIARKLTSSRSLEDLAELVVVCACDDQYAMPLTVMLHSSATRLAAGSRLSVYFLDAGLSDASWIAIKKTLRDLPIEIYAIEPKPGLIEHFPTSHHVTPAAYLRLFAAEMLPLDVSKAIYLDADILLLDDLTTLWDLDVGDNYCLACPDIACPYVDARTGCKNFRKASPYLASFCPLPNYRELGLNPSAEYFNSGVMVMNLDRWRNDEVAGRMVRCLDENREHVWCWDQYALNVVFHGQWGRLPLRWNQGAHSLEFPSASHSPVDRDEFVEMLENPAIMHFTTEFKPWDFHWSHLRGEAYFNALDQTSYHGWRPTRPKFTIQSWWERQAVSLVKHATIQYRRAAAIWHS